jgi:hypothetical protein
MAMRTKGAALGTATNWIFNFMGRSPVLLSCSDPANRKIQLLRLHHQELKVYNGVSILFGRFSTLLSYQ